MHLHVTHETVYDYAPPVRTAQHLAHLRPAQDAWQRLLSHQLSIHPAPAHLTEAVDVHGNTRVFFSLQSAHPQLRVVAESVVETMPRPQPASSMPWEDAREHLCWRRDARFDAASAYLFASPYVPRHADFVAYAGPSFTPGRPLLDAARELASRIHHDFEYHVEATDAGTPALQALALRQGVCQDFAHVMIGCLRSLGLAARYVSGYLLTQPPPGQTRLVGSDASHAWVSVYLPDVGQWADLDPTNDRAPGEDYVVVAMGRDYSDVPPLRGVIQGGASHTLNVAVTVTPTDLAPSPSGRGLG